MPCKPFSTVVDTLCVTLQAPFSLVDRTTLFYLSMWSIHNVAPNISLISPNFWCHHFSNTTIFLVSPFLLSRSPFLLCHHFSNATISPNWSIHYTTPAPQSHVPYVVAGAYTILFSCIPLTHCSLCGSICSKLDNHTICKRWCTARVLGLTGTVGEL